MSPIIAVPLTFFLTLALLVAVAAAGWFALEMFREATGRTVSRRTALADFFVALSVAFVVAMALTVMRGPA